MSPPHSGSGPLSGAILLINKTRILLFVSLAVTWAIASLLPAYKQTVTDYAKSKVNNAIQHLPAVKVDWHPQYDPKAQFNASKLALLIEGRPLPHLVPQLLHMMSIVPPEWRFMFIGTNASVVSVSRSFAAQYHEANGKLDLVVLPEPWSAESKEDVYRMLTDVRFYDEFLPDVEWLLKFESDSIMCSRSDDSINDWLHFSWAGAPRIPGDRFAGNGGLSLRRISIIKKILGFQSRYNDTEPEDEWFGKRITVLPGAKVASGDQEDHFSVEDIWHEKPMGFHVREGGNNLPEDVWKSYERRKSNFKYCPELVMIMPMKLERERCAGDNKEGAIVGAGHRGGPK
ncbi:uncharacterized protein L3040_008586 [Drepanopeziza brunnea f. sp. 'multigermtubi']|uniref:uncharacterized protein n=1 Tax=Drepanopeziza brunnea f. sp. 'multigermtubi' TaxID=698441 RepID=UPI002392263B|nr:hypothetical protein L3040_008586 [Drepanopeziza brunnea f. sp. 'multigermtubi']